MHLIDPATDLSYIAMEWVDGRSLQEVLAETGPPDPNRTVSIIEQVDALPGVEAATFTSWLPLSEEPEQWVLSVEGHSLEAQRRTPYVERQAVPVLSPESAPATRELTGWSG